MNPVALESAQLKSDPNCIDFGIGQPQLEILPRDLLWQASQALHNRHPLTYLNYGHGKGDGRFRTALASFLSGPYGTPQDPDLIFTTGGASQALHLLACTLAQPGDVVLVEEPTYFLAPQIFRDHGLKLVGVPLEKDGVDLDRLEALVKKHRPKFFYTIPVFQNPTGHSTSAEKKRHILEIAERHDFLVVADEVYQLLNYTCIPSPPYANSIAGERVVSVGSFSKILAPGLRLGWIQAAPKHLVKLSNLGLIKSGGGLNHYTGCLVGEALENGSHHRYTEQLKREYSHRVEVMNRCLIGKLSDKAHFTKPEGGYFFWLTLESEVDSDALEKVALKHGTGFRAGRRFSCEGGFSHSLRLSFAHYNENAISVGVDRLARALDEVLNSKAEKSLPKSSAPSKRSRTKK